MQRHALQNGEHILKDHMQSQKALTYRTDSISRETPSK
jgi:hypothetical protein